MRNMIKSYINWFMLSRFFFSLLLLCRIFAPFFLSNFTWKIIDRVALAKYVLVLRLNLYIIIRSKIEQFRILFRCNEKQRWWEKKTAVFSLCSHFLVFILTTWWDWWQNGDNFYSNFRTYSNHIKRKWILHF